MGYLCGALSIQLRYYFVQGDKHVSGCAVCIFFEEKKMWCRNVEFLFVVASELSELL